MRSSWFPTGGSTYSRLDSRRWRIVVIKSHTIAVSPSGTVFHILKDREREMSGNTRPYVGVAAWTRAGQSPLKRVLRAVGGAGREPVRPVA